MRKLLIILFIVYANLLAAQNKKVDSIQKLLKTTKEDTTRVNLMVNLTFEMPATSDTSKFLLEQALKLSKEMKYEKGEMRSSFFLASILTVIGDYPRALELLLKALEISKKIHERKAEALITDYIGLLLIQMSNYKQALHYCFTARKMFSADDDFSFANNSLNIGYAYLKTNKPDSALAYLTQCIQLSRKVNHDMLNGYGLLYLGETYAFINDDSLAHSYFRRAIQTATKFNDNVDLLTQCYLGLAKLFNKQNNIDSCNKYAAASFSTAVDNLNKLETSLFLSSLFEADNNNDSAYYYYKIAMNAKDSLFGQEKIQQVQNLFFNQQQRQQEILKKQQTYRTRVRIYGLIGGLAAFLIIAIILWRNNKIKQRANIALHEKNEQLQSTLTTLKATQSRLIQTEKMASLGELTAGIAHEIQNPLNFVNNFSEVNNELIHEMNGYIDNGSLNDIKAISSDIKNNNEKISYHGKRAEAIVKGMLQHSRQSTGKKEPTDVNALIDEYLRLSYQGFRARDKSFNATIEKQLDESIGKVEVIPQEIGRVFLNLFNNAFYAIYKKKQELNNNFEPVVAVRSWKEGDQLFISVKDNGSGIPVEIKDKIFQPFFTTKPTGEGTGLGLSLSYDIITKMHEGNLEVNTEEGKYAEFIIQLPDRSWQEQEGSV